MTRETKIGLLVGLAFIIVIGILLSDQLMRSTEPPPAQVSNVADNLRKGIVTPAARNQPIPNVAAPRNVSPETQVPTRDEVTPVPSPVTFVEIRPGQVRMQQGGNTPDPTTGGGTSVPLNPAPVAINGGSRFNPPTDLRTPSPAGTTGGRSLVDLAASMGETLLGPDGLPLRASTQLGADPRALANNTPPHITGGGTSVPLSPNGTKTYKCEPGDSLSKIAQKCYGSASKTNIDLIIKANQSLAENPNKVIIGLTYNIPALPAAPTTHTNTPTPGIASAPQPPAPVAPRQPAPAAPSNTPAEYTVQPGDNLTKIATEQCGSATLVPALKELNRDILKGGDKITVNMKLKLPAKPISAAASAR